MLLMFCGETLGNYFCHMLHVMLSMMFNAPINAKPHPSPGTDGDFYN